MNVVVEILSGVLAGRRRNLSMGEAITIGRSESAGIRDESNTELLDIHYELFFSKHGCGVIAFGPLQLENRPLENRPLTDELLQDGDIISAGGLRLQVHFENVIEAQSVTSSEDLTLQSTPLLDLQLSGEFTVETCRNGYVLHTGSTITTPIDRLAELISRRHEAFLFLDHNKADQPLPECQFDFLFDFIDPVVAVSASPVIAAAYEIADWPTRVSDAWGMDAVAVLYTNSDPDQAIAALRNGVYSADSNTIHGLCWPQVFGQVLASDESGRIDELFEIVEMVLVESADLPERWQLFAATDQSPILLEAGLRPTVPISSMKT